MTGDRHGDPDGAGVHPLTAVEQRALDWVIAARDPGFDRWDEFTDWLEADPRHAASYDALAANLRDSEAQIAADAERVIDDPAWTSPPDAARPTGWKRAWYAGGAVAAALAMLVGFGMWNAGMWPGRAPSRVIETAPGEMRVVALADGSEVTVAGGSKLVLAGASARQAVLARGEALFRVRHDADHPFEVRVGTLAVRDLGTVFDVKRGPDMTRVAVAEGAVMVDPDGAAVSLRPGQAVTARGERLIRAEIDRADVGGWRKGSLTYDDARIGEVAYDLTRQTGRVVVAMPAAASLPFRGAIDARAVADDPNTLGPLLGVRVHRDADRWMLEPIP